MKRHAKKHAKKSTRGKRGGLQFMGFDIPVKKTVSDFISNNSFIEQVAPTLASMGPDYAPSKFLSAVDIENFFPDEYKAFVPAAKEFQDGLVEGLQNQGIGRGRRRGYIVMRKKAKGPKKSKRKGRK